MNKTSLLYSTMVLTIVNFVVRIIGFVYRILLSRIIGAEGIGLFQLVMPVHMLTITLVTSGIPIAVSRLVSQHSALGDQMGSRKIVRVAATAVSILAISIMLILAGGIKFIAFRLLKEPRTYLSLVAFIPCILILGVSAVYNGYFYGKKNVHPPALSEIVEQILRVFLVLGAFYILWPLRDEHAAAIAMMGMVIGELAGLIIVQYIYHKEKPLSSYSTTTSSRKILKDLLSIALPITGTRLISSVMQSINAILIPQRLVIAGYSRAQALSHFGMLTGMAFPFIFLPFTLTSALSVVLVPNLSEDNTLKNWKAIQAKISKAISITGLAAFPVTAILLPLGTPLSVMLYNQKEVGEILLYLSPIIIPFCFQHTFSGMLNGLGKQGIAARNYLIGALVLLGCTYFLVSDPRFGIYGYVVGFYLNSFITAGLNLFALVKYGKIRINVSNWFLKPLLASFCMAVSILWSFNQLGAYHLIISLKIILASMLGLVIFAVIGFSMKIISIEMFKKNV